jgi:hypothetical protein
MKLIARVLCGLRRIEVAFFLNTKIIRQSYINVVKLRYWLRIRNEVHYLLISLYREIFRQGEMISLSLTERHCIIYVDLIIKLRLF